MSITINPRKGEEHWLRRDFGSAPAMISGSVHPQDKGKVESAVQIVERWILARLRHRRFETVWQVCELLRARRHAVAGRILFTLWIG